MYAIEGRRFEAGDAGHEPTLAMAHDRRIRPLCLCSVPGIPVYISNVGGAFQLRRMPLTATQHAASCAHFEQHKKATDATRSEAVVSQVPDVGASRLRAAFSLLDDEAPTETWAHRSDRRSGQGTATRLNLRGLMHFLWREAELTRWCPAFAGRRSWAVVRNLLLRGARHKTLNGESLLEAVFIPEAFSVADKENIRLRRVRRLDEARNRHQQPRKKMILIGEVKEVLPPPRSGLVIKHLPDLLFKLDTGLLARMHLQHATEISLWKSASDVRLVAAATFSLGEHERPVIENLCLATTTSQWLPVDDRFEFRLVEKLVQEHRSFEKLLGFNHALPSGAPSAALSDTGYLRQFLALDRDCLLTASNADRRLDGCASPNDGSSIDWVWCIGDQDLPLLPQRPE
jgi:hypothetical protein